MRFPVPVHQKLKNMHIARAKARFNINIPPWPRWSRQIKSLLMEDDGLCAASQRPIQQQPTQGMKQCPGPRCSNSCLKLRRMPWLYVLPKTMTQCQVTYPWMRTWYVVWQCHFRLLPTLKRRLSPGPRCRKLRLKLRRMPWPHALLKVVTQFLVSWSWMTTWYVACLLPTMKISKINNGWEPGMCLPTIFPPSSYTGEVQVQSKLIGTQ